MAVGEGYGNQALTPGPENTSPAATLSMVIIVVAVDIGAELKVARRVQDGCRYGWSVQYAPKSTPRRRATALSLMPSKNCAIIGALSSPYS